MLQGLLKGLVLWIYGLILEGVEYMASALMEVFTMDLAYFETYAPVTSDIINIIAATGWALLIGNLVFQATRSMASGIGFEGEDPKILFTRTAVFSFLLMASRQICDIGLTMTGTVMDLVGIPDSVVINTPEESHFGVFDSSWLLVVIVGIILIFQVIKFFFEIAERYVVMAVLTIMAPLAFGMGGSKNTEDIFKGWARMFGSMCVMMLMNVVFLKLLLSAMSTIPSGSGILPWLLFVVAIARVARKVDDLVCRIGLNPARTGDPLGRGLPLMLTVAVARSLGKTVANTFTSNRNGGQQGKSGKAPPTGPTPNRPGDGGVSHQTHAHASSQTASSQTSSHTSHTPSRKQRQEAAAAASTAQAAKAAAAAAQRPPIGGRGQRDADTERDRKLQTSEQPARQPRGQSPEEKAQTPSGPPPSRPPVNRPSMKASSAGQADAPAVGSSAGQRMTQDTQLHQSSTASQTTHTSHRSDARSRGVARKDGSSAQAAPTRGVPSQGNAHTDVAVQPGTPRPRGTGGSSAPAGSVPPSPRRSSSAQGMAASSPPSAPAGTNAGRNGAQQQSAPPVGQSSGEAPSPRRNAAPQAPAQQPSVSTAPSSDAQPLSPRRNAAPQGAAPAPSSEGASSAKGKRPSARRKAAVQPPPADKQERPPNRPPLNRDRGDGR